MNTKERFLHIYTAYKHIHNDYYQLISSQGECLSMAINLLHLVEHVHGVDEVLIETLPKALRTQALTALNSNFGWFWFWFGFVRQIWFGRFGLVGLVW